jgi:predicted CXXCH cytochrome family protein
MRDSMKKIFIATVLSVVAALSANAEQVNHFGKAVDPDASMAGCVTCHNGRNAGAVSRCDSRMCMVYARHIVDVVYPPPGKERSYASLQEIEIRGFRLSDDRIACTTCHSLTSKNEHLLVFKETGDRFCAGCHRI